LHRFSGPLGVKCYSFGGEWGRGGAILALTNSFFLLGLLRSVLISVKSIKMQPCPQGDTQTDRSTDANRFYNLSHAICYSHRTDKKDNKEGKRQKQEIMRQNGRNSPLLICRYVAVMSPVTCQFWEIAVMSNCHMTPMCTGQTGHPERCRRWPLPRYKTVETAIDWSPCGSSTTQVQDISLPVNIPLRQVSPVPPENTRLCPLLVKLT